MILSSRVHVYKLRKYRETRHSVFVLAPKTHLCDIEIHHCLHLYRPPYRHKCQELTYQHRSYAGIEAGGHGSSQSPTTSLLVTSILTAIPNAPPILAAGGIHTGAQVASVLALGASGAVLGTRLLYTPECGYTPLQKSILLSTTLDTRTTKRGICYDEVNRIPGWPEGIDGRAIANGIWEDYAEACLSRRGCGDMMKGRQRVRRIG